MSKEYYYDILPLVHLPRAAGSFFTYSSETTLKIGSIVILSFHGRRIRGIVTKKRATKPKHPTKRITSIVTDEPYFSKSELNKIESLAILYITHPSEIAKLYIADRIPHKTLALSVRNSFPKNSKVTSKPELKFIENLNKDIVIVSPIIKKTLKDKKQVLFLVPTIEHLSSVINHLQSIFKKETILTLHSSLSSKEHSNVFEKLSTITPLICVALRHGVFAPFLNKGLVIQYDADHNAFVQWDSHPKYRVSDILQLENNYKKVTFKYFPSPEDEEKPQSSQWKKLEKLHFIDKQSAPASFHPLNETLQRAYQKTAGDKKWLFYINRKGIHRYIICNDCNWEVRCHVCDLILAQKTATLLRCARCETEEPMPLHCQSCKGSNLSQLGVGIEKLADYIGELSNKVKPIIIEKESESRDKFSVNKTLLITSALASMSPQSNFDYVVMVNADAEHSVAKWDAEERFINNVWRLLAHTKDSGKLYLQTTKGEDLSKLFSKTTLNARNKQTLTLRKKLVYPPIGEILLLSKKLKKAENIVELQDLKEFLKKSKRYKYSAQLYTDHRGRWQRIIIRSPLPTISLKSNLARLLPKDWQIEINPINL